MPKIEVLYELAYYDGVLEFIGCDATDDPEATLYYVIVHHEDLETDARTFRVYKIPSVLEREALNEPYELISENEFVYTKETE